MFVEAFVKIHLHLSRNIKCIQNIHVSLSLNVRVFLVYRNFLGDIVHAHSVIKCFQNIQHTRNVCTHRKKSMHTIKANAIYKVFLA